MSFSIKTALNRVVEYGKSAWNTMPMRGSAQSDNGKLAEKMLSRALFCVMLPSHMIAAGIYSVTGNRPATRVLATAGALALFYVVPPLFTLKFLGLIGGVVTAGLTLHWSNRIVNNIPEQENMLVTAVKAVTTPKEEVAVASSARTAAERLATELRALDRAATPVDFDLIPEEDLAAWVARSGKTTAAWGGDLEELKVLKAHRMLSELADLHAIGIRRREREARVAERVLQSQRGSDDLLV